MFEWWSVVLIAIGVLNVALGILVGVRNWRHQLNIVFMAMIVALSLWIVGIGGFGLAGSDAQAHGWARVYYVAPLLLALMLAYTSYLFPDRSKLPWSLVLSAGIPTLLMVGMLSVNPGFIIQEVIRTESNREVVVNQGNYFVYATVVVILFTFALATLFLRTRKLTGIYREQSRLFFYSTAIVSVIGIWFDMVLPHWLGNYQLIWVGPLAISFFITVNVFNIIRHKMFDLRLAIVRSLGYGLALIAVALLYSILVFGIINRSFDLQLSVGAQLLLLLSMTAFALSFQWIKVFLSKTTNALFFRDAYDAQELFNQLNKVLISSIDMRQLMTHSATIIDNTLKVEYALICLRGENGYRLFASKNTKVDAGIISRLHKETKDIEDGVLIADFANDTTQASIKELMVVSDIAAMAKLIKIKNGAQEIIGSLILGNKRSGNSFTNQDKKTLEVLADELVIAIQNVLQYEEIQQFNETLQHKIDDATRDLRRANEKLKALDETKDEFISMASHQLRTPLTSVKGYLSMVLEGDAGKLKPQQEELLRQAFISSQRMVYLISDLLNVSRLRTGKFIIEAAPTDLAEVVAGEIDQLVETAKSRGLKLIYDRPADFPLLNLDETKIRQVIMNFVDNAIYYTPKGGEVRVVLEAKPASVELRVIDNGIGVPKHKQHQLFSKFYRADNARRMRPDGTGLGLFMAKKVIIAQGGAILFNSAEGKGSTFGFTFPRKKLEILQ